MLTLIVILVMFSFQIIFVANSIWSSINQINSFVFYFHWKYISLIFIALKSTIEIYIVSLWFLSNAPTFMVNLALLIIFNDRFIQPFESVRGHLVRPSTFMNRWIYLDTNFGIQNLIRKLRFGFDRQAWRRKLEMFSSIYRSIRIRNFQTRENIRQI